MSRYDDRKMRRKRLGRLLSHTDSLGTQVQYEYDSMSRIAKVTPDQGSNYRTQYTFNKNGSLATVVVYDSGSGATTAYTYDTTSGQLTQRNMPTVSSNNIRTTYAYDSAGRLQYETVTREGGGTTNLHKTQYVYSYLTYGRQVIRREQTYSGGWVNDNQLTYKYTANGWQNYEEREDWSGGVFANRYDITQVYDKNGNRTGYDKNVQSGHETTYGNPTNLTTTFDNINRPTSVSDADDAGYSCTITSLVRRRKPLPRRAELRQPDRGRQPASEPLYRGVSAASFEL